MTTKTAVRKPRKTRVNRPVIALSPATVAWEREVYSADPTGGSASRY